MGRAQSKTLSLYDLLHQSDSWAGCSAASMERRSASKPPAPLPSSSLCPVTHVESGPRGAARSPPAGAANPMLETVWLGALSW